MYCVKKQRLRGGRTAAAAAILPPGLLRTKAWKKGEEAREPKRKLGMDLQLSFTKRLQPNTLSNEAKWGKGHSQANKLPTK